CAISHSSRSAPGSIAASASGPSCSRTSPYAPGAAGAERHFLPFRRRARALSSLHQTRRAVPPPGAPPAMKPHRLHLAWPLLLLAPAALVAQPPAPANPQAPSLNPVLPLGAPRGGPLDLPLTGSNLADP